MTMALTAGTAGQASAQTIEERLLRLDQENRQQAAAIERQGSTIAERNQVLEGAPSRVNRLEETLETKRSAGSGGWFENIEIGGLIEVEGSYLEPYQGQSVSDLVLATFELGLNAQVSDWVAVDASLLYEQDETDLEVDLAMITIANLEVTPMFLTAGQFYMPFGAYETNLVSDPLTLEIGESRETAAQLGFIYQGFNGSVYAFNGDNKVKGDDRIESWGANLGYAVETDSYTLSVGAGYINDLGDSNTLQDSVADNRADAYQALVDGDDPRADWFSTDPTERTGGWTANLGVVVGDFNFIAEYLAASERFDADSLAYRNRGAQPSAWNIEIGYNFPVFGRDSVAALAYQGSDEAVALELPETSWLVGWSVEIFNRTALSLEYRHDSDYSPRDDGTGEDAGAVVAQLAVEF
jgi:hypothetical protein